MKARIKGTTGWDDFDPIFNRDGFHGFIRSKWFEENKDKDEYGLFPPNYPLEMLEFPLDNERRWEDIRVNATIEISKALISNTNIVELVESKMYKADLSLEQMVARASVDYANALVDELKRTVVKDESDENLYLTK